MRLVENVGIRRLRADTRQEFKVGNEATASALNRAIILDLTGYEDVASCPCGTLDRDIAAALIFAQACFDDRLSKAASAIEQFLVEFTVLQKLLELARLRRIEVRTVPVDRD